MKPSLRTFSIGQKVTFINMLVSGVALLLACAAFFAYDLYSFRAYTVRSLGIQAQITGANSVSALLFNDARAAEDTLSALRTSPNIQYAEIYTPNGKPFAGYRSNRAQVALPLPAMPEGQTQAQWLADGQIALVRRITFQDKPSGFVYIRSDLRAVKDRLKNYGLITAAVLLLSLVAALLISRLSLQVIAAPIMTLAETARIISREKNYAIRATPTGHQDEVATLVTAFNEMLAQIHDREVALQCAHNELEQRVQERTAQLEFANRELEAFSYSVSHDLRSPLRTIDGFSQTVLEDYGDKLDDIGRESLQRVRAATQRMATLIDDLLNLARVSRTEMKWEPVNLSLMAKSVAAELQSQDPGRLVEFVISDGLETQADSRLMRVVMENLLGNAWKYTRRHNHARIEFARCHENGKSVFFVRDDGAGFDQAYSARLFAAFQRLHSMDEFPGTGVGLATVQRIIHRHGGKVWAEGWVEKGATFYFAL